MPNAPSVDIALFLEEQGIEPVYVSREPPQPDDAITIYDAVAGGQVELIRQGQLERPGIQVRVRGRNYEALYALQENIRDIICATSEFINGRTRYYCPQATTHILYLGRDDNDRFLLTANFTFYRHSLGGT
jgi:hypothetical protein